MSSRFVPGNFQYNGPVALALGPALAVAAAVGGRPVMATLAIGAMISWVSARAPDVDSVAVHARAPLPERDFAAT
eukprot:352421-Chlamydomonas_euryale.AAC.48